MAQRRKKENRDLPPNLYVRRGYYSYRHPQTKKEYGLGRNRALAVSQAIEANLSLGNVTLTLQQRIYADKTLTVRDWCEQYEKIFMMRGLRPASITNKQKYLRVIQREIGDLALSAVSVRDLAELVSNYTNAGKMRTAYSLRSELVDFFKEAIAAGHVTSNPAEVVRAPRVTVQRSRMSLSDFQAILQVAEANAPEWFCRLMRVALITGQRQADLCAMKVEDVYDDRLHVTQQKTGARVAIPLSLEIAGYKLSDNLTPTDSSGKVFTENVTEYRVRLLFVRMREKSGLQWDNGTPPSFHEIRSLSARLYTEQRDAVFAQKLLGHKSSAMTDRYRDERGGWIEL
ncbi:site-specific tyrosine recombinase XerC [Plesiomonas shigelloides]|uniref:phage integrase Arm DNA-binding domain-containing protein n=1 Tax=Plesiomonas shigelloides TaxID=703 RepID=UPI000DFE873F|nr:phage integrase Arm DNA-binding domain-containing protein [Plesiomonas shigelloides]SUB63201.1 site-specific tyrosine recombinase XerC [Plesiomonas shigelloides]